MKKSKPHKIKVRNYFDSKGELSRGANTQVLLDEVQLDFVTSFKYEVSAKNMAKVTLEMYGDFELDIEADLKKSKPKPTDFYVNGKPVTLYTLSSYFPKGIAKHKE